MKSHSPSQAHGGRAIRLPQSFEELRAFLGMPCNGTQPEPPAFEPTVLQEIVPTVLLEEARRVLARVPSHSRFHTQKSFVSSPV